MVWESRQTCRAMIIFQLCNAQLHKMTYNLEMEVLIVVQQCEWT